ncbi:MAG: BatD family protein [Victivallaceae bacterium]|nr:BatD family protein [Victivallaceae bacterium]
MFKRFGIIIFSVLSIWVWGNDSDLQVAISTKRPLAGEVVTVSITADKRPRLTALPELKNAVWLPNYNSSSLSSINFKTRYTQTYAFRVERQGIITIPELEVEVGGKIEKINSIQLQAVSAGEQKVEDGEGEDIRIRDIIFGKVEILNLNQEFYVGEEISLEIDLLSWRRIRVQPTSYPEIKLDKIVFHDYSQQNRQDGRFVIKQENLVELNGRQFVKRPFETAFRPLAPGTLKTIIRIQTEMSMPTERRDFFGSPIYKSTPYTVEIPFEVKVKPLPKAPENASFLELIGNWDVAFSLPDKNFKVDEPFTLTMTAYGLGTLETLNVPKLEVDGFRVYPPEIDKKTGYDGREKAEIKYVFIPLSEGTRELKLNVSVFSTLLHKYKIFDFSRKLKVKKSDNPVDRVNYSTVSPATAVPSPKYREPQAVPRSNILFLKTSPNGRVQVPLYLNWLWAYIGFGLLGPLCWLFSELNYRRRRELGSNKALQRRRNALKRKGKMLKAIRKSPDDELNTVIQHEAVSFINDMLNLPPGTTTSELTKKVKDANLAQCLASVGEASYLPGASNMNKKELRSKLCRALKRLTLIGLLFLAPQLLDAAGKAAKTAPPVKKAAPATFDEAIAAYDSGKFAAAAKFFRTRIVKTSPDPALLYNLGTCLCNEGDMAGALVCFERAHLLAPYDTAVTENLNFVRRRLFLPEVDRIDGPAEMLVAAGQSLRPDEWLLIAALAWAAAGIFLAFRRRLSRNKNIIFIGIWMIIFAAAAAACIFEQVGVYSNANAVVTSPSAELRSLPSMTSGSKLVRLRLGTVVKVIESRLDWVRIKSDNAEGWLRKDKITRIVPGNELPPPLKAAPEITLKPQRQGEIPK